MSCNKPLDPPDQNCIPPADIDQGLDRYAIKDCTLVLRTWDEAHSTDPNADPNLIEIVFYPEKPIMVNGEAWNIQISFRPNDNPPLDCNLKQAKRASYWQKPFFHFVATVSDKDFPETISAAVLLANCRSGRASIKFDPQNVTTVWYEIQTDLIGF